MNKETLSRIISQIDERYIEEATLFALVSEQGSASRTPVPAEAKYRLPRKLGRRVAAACLILIAVIGPAAFAAAAEAGEYSHAVAFFEENGLSAQGLSRSEIKAVYRDITENRFSYEKTAEVIRHTVPGLEIRQSAPTPEELASLWDRNVRLNAISETGISFRVDHQYRSYGDQGLEVLEKSTLECYEDGRLRWSAVFPDFAVEGYADTGSCVMVWGRSESLSSDGGSRGWIACVDPGGQILWKRRLDHGFQNEYVASVLDNGDGTWAVISRGDLRFLCLSRYDAEGTQLDFHKAEVGNLGVWNAARLGDGYLLHLGNLSTGDTALLYKMDREGRITDRFSYEADDVEYHITDLIEFGGRIYLSAYAVPARRDEGERDEIAGVLDYFNANRDRVLSVEEITAVVRDNYTAVLLLCDPDGGAPATFYSVEGSFGGDLSRSASGELVWRVESIASSVYVPAVSSFSLSGECRVFRYTFNSGGALTGQADTGENILYRR